MFGARRVFPILAVVVVFVLPFWGTVVARLGSDLTIHNLRGANERITLQVEGESIDTVLIQMFTGTKVGLELNGIDQERRVSIDFEDHRRSDILMILREELNLQYEVEKRTQLVVTQWSHLSKRPTWLSRDPNVPAPRGYRGSIPEYPEVARIGFQARLLILVEIAPGGTAQATDLIQCDTLTRFDWDKDEICGWFYSSVEDAMDGWRFDEGHIGEFELNIPFILTEDP